jgi:hypothetical protein
LIYLSGLILCLHTLIPHSHEQVFTEVFDQSADHELDFFGLLKGLFSTDLGEDHLEYFAKAGSQPVVHAAELDSGYCLPFIKALTLSSRFSSIQKSLFCDPGPPMGTGIMTGLSRRGPPSAV